MNNKENMINLLSSTAGYFTIENRSEDAAGQCLYTDGCGNHCALGLYLPNAEDFSDCHEGITDLRPSLKDIPEWKDVPTAFLMDVQLLHDKSLNWNDEGLSVFGVTFVERLTKAYNLLEEDNQV